jgi:hypothetical protein
MEGLGICASAVGRGLQAHGAVLGSESPDSFCAVVHSELVVAAVFLFGLKVLQAKDTNFANGGRSIPKAFEAKGRSRMIA